MIQLLIVVNYISYHELGMNNTSNLKHLLILKFISAFTKTLLKSDDAMEQ